MVFLFDSLLHEETFGCWINGRVGFIFAAVQSGSPEWPTRTIQWRGRVKDRCSCSPVMGHTAISSGRWWFWFPWKPDLARFSPRSGPASFLRRFLSTTPPQILSRERRRCITGVCLPSRVPFYLDYLTLARCRSIYWPSYVYFRRNTLRARRYSGL